MREVRDAPAGATPVGDVLDEGQRRRRGEVERQLARSEVRLPVVSLRRVGRAIPAHPVVHLEDREALPPVPGDRPVVGRHEVATACHDLRVEIRGVGVEAETVTDRLT